MNTNIDTVSATIRHTPGGFVVLELSGEIERFDAVDVVGIAAAHGYEIDDVVDESTYVLI
jgi:predicted NAD/FAD-binding protein